MPYFNLTDEAIVDADISSTFQQVLDANNWYEWWAPHIEAESRGSEKLIQVNSVVEIKIHYIMTTKFLAKIKDIKKNCSISVEYFEGDFLGASQWFFEPIGGKTKIIYRFRTKPNRRLIRFLLRFLNFQKAHSAILQSGFKGLSEHLNKRANGP